MINQKILICLSLTLFGIPQGSLRAASSYIESYENKTTARITITMENLPAGSSFDPKTIAAKMKTKEGELFSQTTFDNDLKMLSKEYDRVEPLIQVRNGQVYIELKVFARPYIRAITWSGNSHVSTKTLKKELNIKSNTSFNRSTFNKAFNKVKEYYIKHGYFESQMEYTVVPDPETNEVDIEITVDEGRSGHIDEIRFEGFTGKEKSALLSMIHTKTYNFLFSWLTGEGNYHEEALEHDKLIIVNFLQNRGYADAKVDIVITAAPGSDKIIVVITADHGPLYRFGDVTFQGNTLFTDEQIEAAFLIHPKDIYSPDLLRDTGQVIKEMYGRKGHIDAMVTYDTLFVEDRPIYNAHFKIDEGDQYKIGLIRIFGNTQTKSNVILRESLLIPGETFNSAKLKATQMRLENMGYFKNVNVYAVKAQEDGEDDGNYRDVYIEVEESTTGSLNLFFGFSTGDDVFGGLDLSENNFNYRGIGNIARDGLSAVRGGGEYARARFSVGAKQQTYLLSWMTPYFRDSLWRVGFEASDTRSNLQSDHYTIDNIGFTFFTAYPLNSLWSFGSKYRLRHTHTTFKKGIRPPERKDNDKQGIISAISSTLNYDSTDRIMKPHKGLRSSLEAEFAGLGGPFTFVRLGYTNSYYTELWRNGVMKYRADFKVVIPVWKTSNVDDIPMGERFFLGGQTTVRGYRDFDLGPKFEDGAPKGGLSSSVLSIEYNHYIFKFLDAFVFADGGSLSPSIVEFPLYRLSWGFGTRLEIMNQMPMTIGIGFPVNAGHKGEVRKFFFAMGGQF